MSKVERELTDAEILEWATKDFVLAETKGTLVSTNDANAQGQMPYGIDTSRFSTEQLDGTYQAVITYTWDADS